MDEKSERIDLDRVAFNLAVKSLNESVHQIYKARDDTYHRARAEAKHEVLESLIIKEALALWCPPQRPGLSGFSFPICIPGPNNSA